jgi:hypothetical protein
MGGPVIPVLVASGLILAAIAGLWLIQTPRGRHHAPAGVVHDPAPVPDAAVTP